MPWLMFTGRRAASLGVSFLLFVTVPPVVRGQQFSDFITPTPLPPGHTLVLGFLGGRQPWNNSREGTRRLALRLRARNLRGVHVETLANRKRKLALELIQKAFDSNGDGRLEVSERRAVRLVVYGQSFGGAAVVKLARELEKLDIPVLLTVQVDSIGRGDALIPPNVRRAANLYQRDGLLIRGEPEIRAENSEGTQILGNFSFSYKSKKVDMSGVAWHKKIFRGAHAKMDRDPEVWEKVEELVLAELGKESAARSEGFPQ
ncbi:MAG: hypothetical protein ACRD35_04930 [Candidatus Acidiferrales bacterium]